MGIFDWLFAKKQSGPSVADPSGSIALISQDVSGPLPNLLRKYGRQVDAYEHGEATLLDDLASRGRACIVVEIESRIQNGFLIHKRIKSDGRLHDVPVVLFSSEVDENTFEQHKKLRTRADAYVTSGEPQLIYSAVSSLLAATPR